jgi:hypothetical protein
MSGSPTPVVPAIDTATNVVTIPVPQPPPDALAQRRTFTEEEVAKFRQDERDKLYGQMTKQSESLTQMQERLAAIEAEKAAQADAAAKAQADADAAAKAKAEAEMSAKDYVRTETARLEAQLAEERRQREEQLALFEKERSFTALREYTQQQVAAHRDQIAPELLDLVTGGTQAEIDASISLLVNKSSAIVESIAAAQAQARQASLRGVSATGRPNIGPLDTDPSSRTLTPQQIRDMSPAEYAANRQQLLAAASNQYRSGAL